MIDGIKGENHMKIDIKSDVMNTLNEMKMNATEEDIHRITQRVYAAVIANNYKELIQEAIEIELELVNSKNNKNVDSVYNRIRFEDPVKKDIEKNLVGGLFWWL